MSIRFRSAARAERLDLRSLLARDRAFLRLLNRSKAATTPQLADLARAHLRKAQQRTRQLWRTGYLEQTTLPPASRGRSPLAYRLSRTGRRRLGYHDRRVAGIQELQHRLDTVQAVCALARPLPDALYPVQAWLTESMAPEAGLTVEPDSIVVLQLPSGSAVVCLETNEATQHAPVIRRKLLAYRSALTDRDGWLLLFVVPSEGRRHWLRRQAATERQLDTWQKGWVTDQALLNARGLDATVWPLSGSGAAAPLRTLVSDPRSRDCPTPVGSPAWLELLGSGGGEDFGEALR